MKQVQISKLYPNIRDCYYITDEDKVINVNTGREVKQNTKERYIRVSMLKKDGKCTRLLYHRLKMMAFNPVENMENLQVNHINGNKHDNRLENLEWVTSKENIAHSWKNNLASKDHSLGEKSNLATHTEKEAKQVIELLKTNLYTDKEIHEITGLPIRSFISKIRRRETWCYLTDNIKGKLGKLEKENKQERSTTIM